MIIVRYIVKTLIKEICLFLIIFFSVITLFFVLKNISYCLKHNTNPMYAFILLVFEAPRIIILCSLFGVGLGLMFFFSNLIQKEELIAIKSLGFSDKQIAKVCFVSCCVFALFVFLSAACYTKWRGAVDMGRDKILSISLINSLAPKKLNSFYGYDVFFEKVSSDKKMENVFVRNKDTLLRCKILSFIVLRNDLMLRGEECIYSKLDNPEDFTVFKLINKSIVKNLIQESSYKNFENNHNIGIDLFYKNISQKIDKFTTGMLSKYFICFYIILYGFFASSLCSIKTNKRCRNPKLDLCISIIFLLAVYFGYYYNETLLRSGMIYAYLGNLILVSVLFIANYLLKKFFFH